MHLCVSLCPKWKEGHWLKEGHWMILLHSVVEDSIHKQDWWRGLGEAADVRVLTDDVPRNSVIKTSKR